MAQSFPMNGISPDQTARSGVRRGLRPAGGGLCAGLLMLFLAVQPAGSQTAAPLSPADREAAVSAVRAFTGHAPAESPDDALLAEVARYAEAALGLRLSPPGLDRNWSIAPPARDVGAELQAARATGGLASWIDALEPQAPPYRALLAVRVRYQALVDAGGWETLPDSPALRPGDTHPAVAALRRRLAMEGYGEAGPVEAETAFDAGLEAALRQFQRQHGLAEDGILGGETRRALDVPASGRLQQIDANLERWRWLPRPLPADRIELNIARQDVLYLRQGQVALSMRAIVGKPATRTPMLASRIEAVTLNPSWHVPSSIARGELLPQERRSPGVLARRGFVREGTSLRQVPGPNNALGQVKFEMPSPFGVYLHDTPSRSLFAREDRLFSHGCMRLEKPRELATLLLGDQGWTGADVDAAIDAGSTRRVTLDRPVAVLVVYFTAGVDESGAVWFADDPYGWDRKLIAALARLPRSGAGGGGAAAAGKSMFALPVRVASEGCHDPRP